MEKVTGGRRDKGEKKTSDGSEWEDNYFQGLQFFWIF
jgi:hypothetical protein